MSEDVVTVPEINLDLEKERLKPRIVSCMFADYVGITVSGKPDVCGIFDRIFIDPGKVDSAIVTLFIRMIEVIKGQFKITIFDPNDRIVGTAVADLEDISDKPYPRFVQFSERITLPNLILGTYWFDVSYNGESIGGTPLTAADINAADINKEKKHDGND